VKLGLIVQRYGLDIAGGAELHCRLVAEHLSKTHHVEVFTTCARDYVSWKNEYSRGTETINDVIVHRFRVRKKRNIRAFENIQNLVFHEPQPPEMEESWIRENGPYSPRLVNAVRARTDIDTWIMFSYRYWTTVQSLRIHRKKSLLVPTAEHDRALYLGVVKELFHLPGAIAYNSPEEKQLIQSISGNHDVPGDIVGVGLVESIDADDSAAGGQDYRTMSPYMLYIGRIDKNKGCDHLFRMYRRYREESREPLMLVLIGKPVIPIPDCPGIRHLGFVSEEQKIAALRGCRFLVMPSCYESLSMVLLEAWRYQRPALVNGRCEVLKGQCLRSNGGLVYHNYDEFSENIRYLLAHPSIGDRIGRQGNAYYRKYYSWPVIEEKYENLLRHVSQNTLRGGTA
jgi:glycosyltransferase involved in cell wall biosynthesis